jgi:hypothetical protein
MKMIVRIYKRNIYGVMGTLIFHILLMSIFLLAEIDMKREMTETAILIELPVDEIQEPEMEDETVQPEQVMTSQPSARTNMPSTSANVPGRTSSREAFFDENYQQEIDNARRLVSDVNQQLAREIPDLSKISMPEQVTEGMDRDSIKNIVFTGDSNIEYQLGNRYHLRLPIPVYLAKGGGTVIVDISHPKKRCFCD